MTLKICKKGVRRFIAESSHSISPKQTVFDKKAPRAEPPATRPPPATPFRYCQLSCDHREYSVLVKTSNLLA